MKGKYFKLQSTIMILLILLSWLFISSGVSAGKNSEEIDEPSDTSSGFSPDEPSDQTINNPAPGENEINQDTDEDIDEDWPTMEIPAPDFFGGPGDKKISTKYFARKIIWYDIKEIFNYSRELYSIFQSRFIEEPYIRAVDWIRSNANPPALEPERTITFKQFKNLETLSGNTDSSFFYETDKEDCIFQAPPMRFFQTGDSCQCFPDGIFLGPPGELSLTDANFSTDKNNEERRYDIRYKATHRFSDGEAFKKATLKEEGEKIFSIATGGIFHISSSLDLTNVNSRKIERILFDLPFMLVVDGDIILPSLLKSDTAAATGATATIISTTGSIILTGDGEVDAALVALDPVRGTLKKKGGFVNISGSVAVAFLDFEPSAADSIFKISNTAGGINQATGGFLRNEIRFDPAQDPLDAEAYRRHYIVDMSDEISYWSVSSDDPE